MDAKWCALVMLTGLGTGCTPWPVCDANGQRDFVIDDPGDLHALSGCKVIDGNLSVEGPSDGSKPGFSLSGLSITEIRGSLRFDVDLPSLEGFEALTRVDGDVELHSSNGGYSLRGLDALTSVGGSLILDPSTDNGTSEVDALDRLEDVGGDLALCGIDAPSMLPRLTRVGGALSIGRDRFDRGCGNVMQELSLPVSSVGGLLIAHNRGLRSVELPNLAEVGEAALPIEAHFQEGRTGFSANESNQLQTISSPLLSQIDGSLKIDGLPSFQEFDAPRLHSVGNDVVLASGMSNLDGLAGLERIGGDLVVRKGDFFDEEERARAEVTPRLDSFDGLSSLTKIGGLSLTDSQLSSLRGLEGVELERMLFLRGNAFLEDISALRGVSRLSELHINGNARLVSLAGLEELARVDAEGGDDVPNESFEEGYWGPPYAEDGDMLIQRNPALLDLTALANLSIVTGDLRIADNALLATCEAEALAARVERSCGCAGNDAEAACE